MIELRHYQRAAVDSIYGYFAHSNGHPLVVLPTGSGKSVVIAAFTQGLWTRWQTQRVLILTHVEELFEQIYERLMSLWPGAPACI